jgi:predicted Zn-dependent protease
MVDRIATFKSFIAKNPKDPFPRYSLAMEHKTRGELDQAWTAFQDLIATFPDYVAAYLMAGNTLAGLGRGTDAADIYRRGITAATQKHDTHARGELEAALAELGSSPAEARGH